MPDPPPTSSEASGEPDPTPATGTPHWVKVSGIIAAIVVLALLVMLLIGGPHHHGMHAMSLGHPAACGIHLTADASAVSDPGVAACAEDGLR